MNKDNNKDKNTQGFSEAMSQETFQTPLSEKLKQGKMSKALEYALDAVERMTKKNIH